MRIQVRREIEKRRQQVVSERMLLMVGTEILHRARPVDVGDQAGEAEAEEFQEFRRADIQAFFQGGIASRFADPPDNRPTA